MSPAESYQVARTIRKLSEAMKYLATARSSLNLLSPEALAQLGVTEDVRKLEVVNDELSAVRHRLGYHEPRRSAPRPPPPAPPTGSAP